VGVEEDIEPVSTDGAAPVENFYWFPIVVAGNEHFSAEAVFFVSRNEGIAGAYFMTAGRWAT
jgi:hypothetical protein